MSRKSKKSISKSDVKRQRARIREFLLSLFPKNIYLVDSHLTRLQHGSCKVVLLSDDSSKIDCCNIQPLIFLLDNEPYAHYVMEKDFDDEDYTYFCRTTVWGALSFEIEGETENYLIKKLAIVNILVDGHPFSQEVFVQI